MDQIKKDFQQKLIKNFLTKEEVDLLEKYTKISHRINEDNFDKKNMNTADTCFYGQPLTDALLLAKQSLLEKECGITLLPCYSYWRMYTYNAVLPMHYDRYSCEISATVNVGGDKKWPFIAGHNVVDLNPGDALIYTGSKLPHGRGHYEGDWCSQIFLHYVDAEGEYTNMYKDKRKFFGMDGRIT